MSGTRRLIVLFKFWSEDSEHLPHEQMPTHFVEAVAGHFDHTPDNYEILGSVITTAQKFERKYDQMEDIGRVLIGPDQLKAVLAESGWNRAGFRVRPAAMGRSESFKDVLKLYGLPPEWAMDQTSKLWTPGGRHGPKIDDVIENFKALGESIDAGRRAGQKAQKGDPAWRDGHVSSPRWEPLTLATNVLH